MDTLTSIVKLSRWKEHINFVVPLSLLGILLAHQIEGTNFGFKVLFLVLANFLSVAFAFMINDIADAEDDQESAFKAARNPVSAGKIGKSKAYTATFITALIAIIIFYYFGGLVFVVGVGLILLSFFYSVKPLRLKSYPVVDIVSHSLMLGGILVFLPFIAYSHDYQKVLFMVLGVTLISVYGQIYNQLRDIREDKKAGLKNTTILLGEKKALSLSYLSIFFALVFFVLALLRGQIPYFLIIVAFLAFFIAKKFIKGTDASGIKSANKSGSLQIPAEIVFNVVIFTWFLSALLSSFFSF